MSTTTIIQHRRGNYVDFDPQKMKPAELAVVQSGDPISSDGKGVYVGIQAGDVKRLATMDDMTDEINAVTDNIVEQVHEAADEILESVPQIQQNTSDIADLKADFEQLEEEIQNIDPLSEDAKAALLNCFRHVGWIDEHGQTYYDTLYDALYPDTGLVRIEAVFTQGDLIVYPSTPLKNLKAYLVVTGYYTDGTEKRIKDYALSGDLTVGTSTITVTSERKTTTFTVTVSEEELPVINIQSADLTYGYGCSDNDNQSIRPKTYSYSNPKRATYLPFDLEVEPGASYKLEWDRSVLPDSRIAISFITETGLEKVETSASMGDDAIDCGWQQYGAVVKVPETFNSSTIAVVRATFKGNDADTLDVTSGSIGWVKLTKDVETEDADKTRIIPFDEFAYHTGVLSRPPYYQTGINNRICVWQPIDIHGGVTYEFIFKKDSSYPNVQCAANAMNEIALNSMKDGVTFDGAANTSDPSGYIDTNRTVAVPSTLNDSPVKGMRLSFKPNSSNSGTFSKKNAVRYIVIIRRF